MKLQIVVDDVIVLVCVLMQESVEKLVPVVGFGFIEFLDDLLGHVFDGLPVVLTVLLGLFVWSHGLFLSLNKRVSQFSQTLW